MSESESPFQAIPPSEWIASNRSGFALWDRFPVSAGHALIVSRRLIANWWGATAEERSDLLELVEEVKQRIDEQYAPDAYNVGFNAGEAAGQTVEHLHVHVIPRYAGDVPDPRGGIRHVIPEKANYLASNGAKPAVPDPAELFDGSNRVLDGTLIALLRDSAFDRVDLVVSFVMRSGLQVIGGALEDALEREAEVRILTTDYLRITEHAALAQLKDLAEDSEGGLTVRIFQDPIVSFHPKAYLFWNSTMPSSRAIVGSSNLSRSGLSGGVEWNLAVGATAPMLASFNGLWDDPRSRPLTSELLSDYHNERPPTPIRPELQDVVEPPIQPVTPRPIQREALSALEHTRLEGYRAGLVVMATGLGKTWLAAFDTARPQFRRVLFVAHREEILRQSRAVFRQVQPDGELGLYFGGAKEPEGRVVFAGVQTLARHLDGFDRDAFDYVVVDEFHHASASSYRAVLEYFEPEFLLGLTATPERMDGADLLALCADNLVYDCGIVEGIERDELVPFHYWGVADTVDFEPIPWRNGRFDPESLTRAVETHERADRALAEWREHGGGRTLGFCASITHADFMAAHFRDAGVDALSVHTGPTSAPRHESIEDLRAGRAEVVFAVDLFNEGLDVPEIDAVLMLRPTESPVVFLQQLGRGLRTREGKESLAVVDFIGNHRSFLAKPRALLSLGSRTVPSNTKVLKALEDGDFPLPPGCSVDYELAAIEMLRELTKGSARSGLAEYVRSYAEEEGARPSANQAFRAGYNPASVRAKHGSWFGFLGDEGLLSDAEEKVSSSAGDVLAGFETEQISKSYKLVTLKALLHEGKLRSGMTTADLATAARQIILRDPRLLRDLTNEEFPDLANASPEAWELYWRRWPIAAWTGELRGKPGGWFRLDDDRMVPTFSVSAELGDTFDAMAAELVEYRLARYLAGKDADDSGGQTLRLGHADGRPLIWLDRARNPNLPEGEVPFVAGGTRYTGRFMKAALNVAELPGESGNALHALLRGWFGPAAGHPGTSHQVVLSREGEAFVLRPLQVDAGDIGQVLPLFPSYAVACSAFADSEWQQHSAAMLELSSSAQVDPATQFVCFARGDSMDGGPDPVRHGDPLVLEWVRSGGAEDYVGSRVLVEYSDQRGVAAALKRLARDGTGFELRSDNPDAPPIAASAKMRVIARLVRRLDQAEINPLAHHIGDRFKRQDVPGLFDLTYNPGNWQSGHVSLPGNTILFVTLIKDDMGAGAHYVDHFEGAGDFVWSSQTSTSPEGKKGQEILNALENGTRVHLFARRKKTDVAFTYLGLIAPISHEGSKPMSVRFRLLTPIAGSDLRELTSAS